MHFYSAEVKSEMESLQYKMLLVGSQFENAINSENLEYPFQIAILYEDGFVVGVAAVETRSESVTVESIEVLDSREEYFEFVLARLRRISPVPLYSKVYVNYFSMLDKMGAVVVNKIQTFILSTVSV